MTINNIVLLTIVSSFVACGHAAPTVVNDELTFNQLLGEWFEIGRISTCSDSVPQSCVTHNLRRFPDPDYDLSYFVVPYENFLNCDRGVPIYTDATVGNFVNSTLYLEEYERDSLINSTIKSYNDGNELILTVVENESCQSTSYRLWSRQRDVSAEVESEFEKLAGDGTIEYYSFDHCPKVRSEVDEDFVDVKFEGLWYDIAQIYFGDVDNDTCTTRNITVNYEKNTFTDVMNLINDGRLNKTIREGELSESGMAMNYFTDAESEPLLFYGISCNNGEDLIMIGNFMPHIALTSRNPKVSAETMAEFERLADIMKKIYPDRIYTTYSHDGCPKWNV